MAQDVANPVALSGTRGTPSLALWAQPLYLNQHRLGMSSAKSGKKHREGEPMCIWKSSASYWMLFLGVVLFALVVDTPSLARTAPAEPTAGQEPPGPPIVYNLEPEEGASVEQDELSRASATIETRRVAKVASATIYVDGERRPSDLKGPTPYQQTISADIEYLSPGTHTVRVKAVDSEGLKGGYVWKFTVS